MAVECRLSGSEVLGIKTYDLSRINHIVHTVYLNALSLINEKS